MVEGHYTDTKIAIKAVMPRLYRLNTQEVLLMGVMFGNSDFGNGPLEVSFYLERLVCRNGMIAERSLHKVHLGARLDDGVEWSLNTQVHDQKTLNGMVGDLVTKQLGTGTTNSIMDQLRAADADMITAGDIKSVLAKNLNKGEALQVTDTFNSADIVNLPAGQTRYRLANALSWVAGKTENEERRLDLQKLAGRVITQASLS